MMHGAIATSMPRYRCPECSLVIELSKKKAQEANKCVQCGASFEPHIHPAGNPLHPSLLSGQGKEELSIVDLIGTYIIILGPIIGIGMILSILGFFMLLSVL
jgi:NAD-dependent SIR2 family protein deacetylase